MEAEKTQIWNIFTTVNFSDCWCQKLLSTYVHKIRLWLPPWCPYFCLSPCPSGPYLSSLQPPEKASQLPEMVHKKIGWDCEASVILPSLRELSFFHTSYLSFGVGSDRMRSEFRHRGYDIVEFRYRQSPGECSHLRGIKRGDTCNWYVVIKNIYL